jgi:hypothetical protein
VLYLVNCESVSVTVKLKADEMFQKKFLESDVRFPSHSFLNPQVLTADNVSEIKGLFESMSNLSQFNLR